MISTGEMYGNVQEEKDEFVVLQEKLAKRAEEAKKFAESVPLPPQLKASEIKLPDFPEEYIEAFNCGGSGTDSANFFASSARFANFS